MRAHCSVLQGWVQYETTRADTLTDAGVGFHNATKMSDKVLDTQPRRIQKKRKKGWRTPANTRYVGRPTRWGNPFSLKEYDLDTSLRLYEEWVGEKLAADPTFLDELKGMDLACYCKPTDRCHADIIIRKIGPRS